MAAAKTIDKFAVIETTTKGDRARFVVTDRAVADARAADLTAAGCDVRVTTLPNQPK